MPVSPSQPLPVGVRAELFRHLAAMEQAGVPLDQAFAALQLPAAFEPARQRMQRYLAQGRDLASAGGLAGLFSPLEVSLLQAAQAAGSPAPLYRRLADGYASRERQQQQIRARLLLPAVVLLLALFILPVPALVNGSLSGVGYIWAVLRPLLLLAGLIWLLRAVWMWLQHGAAGGLLRALPLLGRIYLQRNLCNFFDSLGLLLNAGVPILDALPRACATLGDVALRRQFERLVPAIAGGQTLGSALRQLHEFPGKSRVLALVATGEGSGRLAEQLLSHAAREGQLLADLHEQLATWLPRLGYLLVAAWLAYGLLTGGGFSPVVPAELR